MRAAAVQLGQQLQGLDLGEGPQPAVPPTLIGIAGGLNADQHLQR